MSFTRNLADKYGENIIGYCHKITRLDAAKSASRKVVHKTAEATGELIENQITEQILKAKSVSVVNSRNVEDVIAPPEKGKKC